MGVLPNRERSLSQECLFLTEVRTALGVPGGVVSDQAGQKMTFSSRVCLVSDRFSTIQCTQTNLLREGVRFWDLLRFFSQPNWVSLFCDGYRYKWLCGFRNRGGKWYVISRCINCERFNFMLISLNDRYWNSDCTQTG